MQNPCYHSLVKLLLSQKRYMDALYLQLSVDLAKDLQKYKSKSGQGPWIRNSQFEKKVDKILIDFNSNLEKHINLQKETSWNLANDCNDTLIETYSSGIQIPDEKYKEYLFRDSSVLQSFLKRKDYGMGLSDRVWNITKQSKEQLELVLQSGVLEGRPAREMARDLKQFLNEPDRRYRRIRNKHGKLVYTNPAKEYKPGRGIYRSSFKNALRLSKNETNIAYKASDYERRQNLDFITGVLVNLSPAHPKIDICDHLTGRYPKGFKFYGWHTGCICYQTAILLPKKDFVNYLNTGRVDGRRVVKGIPRHAQNHINEISDQIKGWKNAPYFIRDNFTPTANGYKLN